LPRADGGICEPYEAAQRGRRDKPLSCKNAVTGLRRRPSGEYPGA